MKKKIVILLLALVITVSGCGESGSTSASSSASDISEVLEESVEEVNDNEIEENKNEVQKETLEFKEITVVDNDECSIKITGIDPGDLWGYTLKAYLENKSPDKTYMFSANTAAINGVQCDPLFATEVAAEKKSNNDITFSLSNDIGDFTDIEISFRVYDSDDWMADAVAEETVHIYPYGENNATTFMRESQDTDNVIIDNEYVTVTITGYEHDDIWGYTVNLFLINKSDKEVMFSVNDSSVNGYMIDPFYAISVMPKKCAFSSMSWSDSALEENGVSDVEEIEFFLRAYDSNDFAADDFANEVIALNP